MRKLRYWLSSGAVRDTHGLSLPERRTAKRWRLLMMRQVQVAMDTCADEEHERAFDMMKIYVAAFFKTVVVIPPPEIIVYGLRQVFKSEV